MASLRPTFLKKLFHQAKNFFGKKEQQIQKAPARDIPQPKKPKKGEFGNTRKDRRFGLQKGSRRKGFGGRRVRTQRIPIYHPDDNNKPRSLRRVISEKVIEHVEYHIRINKA